MYDIEVVVPVSDQGKYHYRLLDFKKYGLLNVQDKKVLLKLLIGTESKDAFLDHWDLKIDIELVSCWSNCAVSKLYDYYGNLKDVSHARWFAKFDDDSITDINGLVDNLDLEYDYTMPNYICTTLCEHKHFTEIDLLAKLGYVRWLDPKCHVLHEWEGSVVSQDAMKRMIENEISKKFLIKRSKIEHGVGDVALAIAARISKVHPVVAYFMTQEHAVKYFSLFGGKYNHIHYLAADVNQRCFDVFRKALDHVLNNRNKEGVEGNYLFLRRCRGEEQFISSLTLQQGGLIVGFDSKNECFWNTNNNYLNFLDEDYRITTIFDLDKGNEICGVFQFEYGVQHVLRRL